MRRWEWAFLLCGAVVSAGIAVSGVVSKDQGDFFWGLAAGLAFGALIAWLYSRESK